MVHIQKRLDVVIALTGQEMGNYRAALAESASTAREEWAESNACHRLQRHVRYGECHALHGHMHHLCHEDRQEPPGQGEEILNLRTKYAIKLEDRKRLGRLKDFPFPGRSAR